jgi:CsbD-like
LKVHWKELKEKWGKLTDDDLTAINGKRDQLQGRLQQRYGFAKDQVRKMLIVGFLPSNKPIGGNHDRQSRSGLNSGFRLEEPSLSESIQ